MFTRVSHIGIVVHDLDEAVERWSGTFGLTVTHRMEIAVEGVRNALLRGPGQEDGFFIELMEPTNKDDHSNAIARRLARHGEGVYQVAVVVDDTAASAETLSAAGFPLVIQPPTSPGQATRPIIHPKAANGVLLELIQGAKAN